MEAAAHAEAHAAHPPIANKSSRVDAQLLGILLFIISEAMLFGSFFTAYFFIRVVQGEAWPPEPFHFPINVALMNTLILVSSSFTMHYALHSIKRGNRTGLQVGLVTTFLMGAVFLGTQVNEYFKAGFAISDGSFASVFYGLTGLHGAHVFIGLTLLSIANIRTLRGHFNPDAHMGVEVTGIYWHFVDIMWIIVFSTVYVL
jgi:cytochrome c oxidase subunit III